jgi:hypothetical protein
MRIDVSMGTFGPGVDQDGETVPDSMAKAGRRRASVMTSPVVGTVTR